jgi:serine/threonine-protein kinase
MKIFAADGARGTGRDALARFEREVRALAALDHPSVVALRDYVPEGPAIVLAWMPGGTLEEKLAAGMLAPARAAEIAGAILSALGEAHRLGIVHRDVKPSNVLFDEAGAARLADFGVAHLGDLSTTATAGVIGTMAYMSPEQREGRPATVESDLFSVGVMLLEMLTGERPNPNTGFGRTRLCPSEAHPQLDARHDALVARWTAVDPRMRPGDAFEARRDLLALPWPSTPAPHAAQAKAASVHPVAGDTAIGAQAPEQLGRLEVKPDGAVFDRWIERKVEQVYLDDRVLARAAAFAAADHPALQTVLRVDKGGGALWFAPAPGRPLDGPLSSAQSASLLEAVEALHAGGIVHGHIDRAHVWVDTTGGVTLTFAAECDPAATVERDRLALARL